MPPHPPPPISGLNEQLDEELDRFDARSRRGVWRSAFYAVLGAILVVGFGIWSFGIETNTRNAPARHAPAALPQDAPVMVVINPG